MAAPLTISEWVRETVLRAPTHSDPVVTTLLAELLALRMIVLNLQFAVVSGTDVTADAVRGLIERADHDKWSRAEERLAATRVRTESASR